MFTPGTILTEAVKAQVAIDGKYEDAYTIYPPYDYASDPILEFINNFTSTISIEFFYLTDDKRTSYFGIKYKKGEMLLTPQDFVIKSVQTFIDNQNFKEFIPALGVTLANNKSTFLSKLPDQIELGVNEWWFTFGPQPVWKRGDMALTRQHLTNVLVNREDLMFNPRNFVGAEVIFSSPIEHWISTQVSSETKDGYKLNFDQVLAIAQSAEQIQ